MEQTITVEVENDAIDLEKLVYERDATLVLKDNDEPIQATVGPAIAVNDD